MKGVEAAAQGRLTCDPEMRETKTGKTMAVVNIAVDEGDDATTFIKVLAFDDQAERVRALPKGAALYAEGRLKAEAYSAQDGAPRAALTLLARLVQPLGQIGKRRPPRVPTARATEAATSFQRPGGDPDLDDEIPF